MDNNNDLIEKELLVIDSLLRNEKFSITMAAHLDSAYYVGVGETPQEFITPEDETNTFQSSEKTEFIATNIAGFYALECGISFISSNSGQSFVSVLKNMLEGKIDSTEILILNRFANATWKASQPFRDLERIKRPIFMVANFLPDEEIKKDYHQVQIAGRKLWESMEVLAESPQEAQMQKLRSLLQDTNYAFMMAAFIDSAYAATQGQLQVSKEWNDTPVLKSMRSQKIASSLAGFYALESGINYLAKTRGLTPSDVLKAIVDDSLSEENLQLFARFANATWKAGQPFKGLDRIKRETFTPFYFLSKPDIDKDLVQIKAAAGMLLQYL
ncbi:MAG: hypothetical protein EOO04_11910 [Chitinophagaceae bacterium]|nr:MAG: hypothetical protein EOO04_11910 [Chitinophagaceae bacterium]